MSEMDVVKNILQLIAVPVSLAVIIVLLRRGWYLSLSVWTALPVMAVLSFFSAGEVWHSFRVMLTDSVTHNLVLAVLGIGLLGEVLYYNGSINAAISALKKLIKDTRFLVAAIPAFIGLMPIPGGAYLSAPLVKEVGEDINMGAVPMVLANVFYRHILYFVFPLYPGFITVLEMSEVSLHSLLGFSVIPFIIAFGQSFWQIFNKVPVEKSMAKGKKETESGGSSRIYHLFAFGASIFPILVALAVPLVTGWPYFTGLAAGVLVALFQNLPRKELKKEAGLRLQALKTGVKGNILLTIPGVLLFKELVEASGMLDMAADLMEVYGIPVMVIALVIPYLTGIFIGHHIAAVALSLPLLMPLLPGGAEAWPFLGLIYLSSLMGYIISPLHLCPILTVEYFKVPLHVVLYRLMVMTLGAMAAALGVVWVFG